MGSFGLKSLREMRRNAMKDGGAGQQALARGASQPTGVNHCAAQQRRAVSDCDDIDVSQRQQALPLLLAVAWTAALRDKMTASPNPKPTGAPDELCA
jgi:hypothetical protein